MVLPTVHMFEALGGIGEMLVTGPIRENFCFGEIFFSEKFLFRANFCFGHPMFPICPIFPKNLGEGRGGGLNPHIIKKKGQKNFLVENELN